MPVARECGLCGWLAHAKAMFNLGGLPRVAAPYMQQETWAWLVFYTSVAAFAVGEFSQAMTPRLCSGDAAFLAPTSWTKLSSA